MHTDWIYIYPVTKGISIGQISNTGRGQKPHIGEPESNVSPIIHQIPFILASTLAYGAIIMNDYKND